MGTTDLKDSHSVHLKSCTGQHEHADDMVIRPFFEAVVSLASNAFQLHGTQPRVVASHEAWLDRNLRQMARRQREFLGRYSLGQKAHNHEVGRIAHPLK